MFVKQYLHAILDISGEEGTYMYSHHCTPYDNTLKFVLDSWNSEVNHYKVKRTHDSKLTVDDKTFFENLTELVEVGHVINKQ